MKTIAMLRRGIAKTAAVLRIFRRNPRGVAAVEFALILPVALALFTGAVVYGDAIAIERKVTVTTRTVTDLVTQYPTISQADLQTLLGASAQIMAPYSATNVQVRVSQVAVDSGGNATISWSQPTLNWTGRPTGQVVTTLPTNIKTPGAYYIWGEVQYAYTPTIGYIWTGTYNLQDQTFMAPRVATAGIPTPQ